MMESNLSAFRVLVGIVLLILTSLMVGREYQYGTIRILLARGAGRVQLLLAKLATLALIALALLVAFSLLTALLICIFAFTTTGNLNILSAPTPAFWSNTGIDLLAVTISIGATILLALAMNALARSLAFGLSASLAWFAIDNMGTLVMGLLSRLTHSNFWLNVTAYFLGPLLNRLPDMLLPKQVQTGFEAIGPTSLIAVGSTHALRVIFGYALIFIIVALVPTWKRDVKE
jgi:ABC-2 type transport system permease protein